MPADRLYPEPTLSRDADLLVDRHDTRRSLLRALLKSVMLALLAALVGVGVFMLSRIACDTPPIRDSGLVLPHLRSTQIDDPPR